MNTDRLFPTARPPASVIDTLAALSERQPDKMALTVLHDGEQPESVTSFSALHRQVQALAAVLCSRWPQGTRVVLLLPNDADCVCTFLACLAAGMVAVPAHPPQQTRKPGPWRKLQGIVDNCGARVLVTTARALPAVQALQQQEGWFAGCDVESSASLMAAADLAAPAALPRPRVEDVAFLQYTSGSTGSPKGVVLTHGNILANQQLIGQLMGTTEATRFVSWLPLYHDMGLSQVFQMAAVGCSVVMMPPAAFAQKPLRWLQAVSDYRADASGGPNFAYRLATAALQSPQAQGLDLSCWQLAFCGAEPIARHTVEAFLRSAAPHGLQAKAFCACYGMAEATVQVSGAGRGTGPRFLCVSGSELARGRLRPCAESDPDARSLVGCGDTGEAHEILIVTPAGRPVEQAGDIGEVWVRGPSVGQGYWELPQVSRDTFEGRLQGDTDGPAYLRTGDLGALLDGQLYVTGRLKDLLIIRGRNFYPQDVEETVQASTEGLRSGCGAAVAVPVDGEEQLVVVQEVARDHRRHLDAATALRNIVRAVVDEHGVMPYEVVLVEPATIEKTSSGKIARAWCRQAWQQGQLQRVASWREGQPMEPGSAPASADQGQFRRREMEDRLAGVVAAFLGLERSALSRSAPWSELGLDSVRAVQLLLQVERALGVPLETTLLWERATIQELAEELLLREAGRTAVAGPPPAAGHGAVPNRAAVAAMSEAEAEAALQQMLQPQTGVNA
ncbi:AMP-binding protein [Eleftheria terrae]|uniref:AMP-binding protein n=1 Tax=Eleftheria terrae TaxID=1597781 RepID=UPI00263B6B8D|nr:AMP-binding protein [Eleftheria terrae]WKB53465.1 AMP-binding protein [Eleftheria terrae]